MNGFLNLSEKLVESYDISTVEILSQISNVAYSQDIPFFVIGATARDFILKIAHEIPTPTATLDIDIGVQVNSREQYQLLSDNLTNKGLFKATSQPQMFKHNTGRPIDIIPYGPTQDSNMLGNELEMNVIGFEDAYAASLLIRLKENPPLEIRFANLVGIFILKIFAWSDNVARREKDALDIANIMDKYLDAGNYDRMIEEHLEWFDGGDFDHVLSGVRLLGTDIKENISFEIREAVLKILKNNGNDDEHALVDSMFGGFMNSDNYPKRMEMIKILINEINQQ